MSLIKKKYIKKKKEHTLFSNGRRQMVNKILLEQRCRSLGTERAPTGDLISSTRRMVLFFHLVWIMYYFDIGCSK